jgi:hypothetical protein
MTGALSCSTIPSKTTSGTLVQNTKRAQSPKWGLGREAGAPAAIEWLVGVALQQGTIFNDVGEAVCHFGVEVRSLKSVVQGSATTMAVRSGSSCVAGGGLLGEEIVAISVHLPLYDG